MYKASRQLQEISKAQMDGYLAEGWYRMEQRVFTEQFLQEGLRFRNAVWLRQDLRLFEFPKWYRKMREQGRFGLEVMGANPWPAHELLYQQYLQTKPDGFPGSLENILFGRESENIFPTEMMNVYDGRQLIAAGFFDLGEKSAAGIVNFYLPEYSKYRLGKFLYLFAIESSIEAGMEYFYPGYFVPGNRRFDYKLEFHPESLEFYHAAQRTWLPYSTIDMSSLPLEVMEARLRDLLQLLEKEEMPAFLAHNATYSLVSNSRWDSPYVLLLPGSDLHPETFAVSYDTHTSLYNIFFAGHIEPEEDVFEEEGILACLHQPILRAPLEQLTQPGQVIEKMRQIRFTTD
jgi:arginine-tRNA-protein transferase